MKIYNKRSTVQCNAYARKQAQQGRTIPVYKVELQKTHSEYILLKAVNREDKRSRR